MDRGNGNFVELQVNGESAFFECVFGEPMPIDVVNVVLTTLLGMVDKPPGDGLKLVLIEGNHDFARGVVVWDRNRNAVAAVPKVEKELDVAFWDANVAGDVNPCDCDVERNGVCHTFINLHA